MSLKSKLWNAMGRLGDLTILNFLFLLTCLPVITIGPALTALYAVTFRNTREWGTGTIRAYFRAFRDNFKQSILVWLIVLLVGVCTYVDTVLFYRMSGPAHYLFIPAAILLLVVLLAGGYLFPLLSQFETSTKQALKNSLILGLGYLPRSVLIAAMNVLPFYILAVNWPVFFEAAFLWVFWYFSSIAYFNVLLLKKVFKPYRNDDEEEEAE